ncbi:hypothetical protein [Anaerovorax odorimutans]|uniref:hypothetical protein n=1 Tax=Anaerovorax odorimutans TaxID=109327 RepID=UPI000423EE85|nr:hypothetical protein [Anaerovorax odorimutans]
MYLIITALAAVITTIIWYVNAPDNKYKLGTLTLIFWGATLMWLVDHVIAFLTEGGEFFDTSLDATLLGITVTICGLLAWTIILLISDPKGIYKKLFQMK